MLEVWHQDVQNYVSEKGYIRTYDGRIRHLPNVFSPDEGIAKQAMRQAINSPVQAIASDLGIMTLGRLIPHIEAKGYDWIKPCGFIHDAIVCLVKEEYVAQGCALVKRFMENNPLEKWFDWTPEIPIIADAEIGRTLAETYEIGEELFTGKNSKSSYVEILSNIRNATLAKAKKEKDKDKKAKLIAEAEAVANDIAKSGKIPSRSKSKRTIIKTSRGIRKHAKASTTQTDQKRTIRVRKSLVRGTGSDQRRKPPKDRAA